MPTSSLPRLIQLFTLAATAATERLTARLALVLRDPIAYETEYAEELLERSIEAGLPHQELRDVALIDALLSEDLLWEADWKESAESIAESINDILAQQKRSLALPLDTLATQRSTGPEALDAVQDALEPLGLALVLFTLDSDSYPLSVVADAQAEELRQLAQQLGFGVAVY